MEYVIWVCIDCMLHHANGECGDCHDDVHGHDKEPWGLLQDGETVTQGMSCMSRIEGCDCEMDTHSTSQCEGCGSYLHGERHAFTVWDTADQEC